MKHMESLLKSIADKIENREPVTYTEELFSGAESQLLHNGYIRCDDRKIWFVFKGVQNQKKIDKEN